MPVRVVERNRDSNTGPPKHGEVNLAPRQSGKKAWGCFVIFLALFACWLTYVVLFE